jgi:hypothetical protein
VLLQRKGGWGRMRGDEIESALSAKNIADSNNAIHNYRVHKYIENKENYISKLTEVVLSFLWRFSEPQFFLKLIQCSQFANLIAAVARESLALGLNPPPVTLAANRLNAGVPQLGAEEVCATTTNGKGRGSNREGAVYLTSNSKPVTCTPSSNVQ